MSIRLAGPPHRHTGASPAKRPGRPRGNAALVPAAARTRTALTPHELDLSGDAIEAFTRAVGGRAKLLATLAISESDTASDKVVNCLLDDTFASWSLRRICAYAGLTVADLFASYKKALFVQAHIEAAHLITDKLPPIVADVMMRALPGTGDCPRCHGEPTTPGCVPCPRCDGAGTIPTEPDLDRQKLALELGHLTERKAGIMVQQNAITAGAAALQSSSAGSLEQLQQAVGDLLFSPTRRRAAAPASTIDVSPVPDPREPAPAREEPRPDVPLPISEPEEENDGDDEDEEDEDDDRLTT